MKSLSLPKPLVLIVVGLPGSGKSFFARQFSQTFQAPVVSHDHIRSTLFGSNGYAKNEQDTVEKIAQISFDELLKTHKTFIVDGGGVSRAQRASLRKKATAAGYGVLIVWVQTDPATSKYRSMKRSSRRKDDTYNTSLSGNQYDQLARRFSTPASNETSVVISGKHTYATQAKVVLKKLVRPREEAARSIVNHPNRVPNASPPRRNVIIR